MFQTIKGPNVWNILGVDGRVSTVDFTKEGVTKRIPLNTSWRLEVLAAAHEVNNLQAVAVRETGPQPLLSRNDTAVQLHGDAIRFHVQLVDKPGESKGRVEIASFAIDLQLHIIWIFAARRKTVELCSTGQPGRLSPRDLCLDFAQVKLAGCGAAGVVGLHEHGGIRE